MTHPLTIPSSSSLPSVLLDLVESYEVAWATDLRLDHYEGDVVELGAKFARESSANILVLTGDTSSSPQLAGHLADLQEGWNGHVAFVLGNQDRWFASFAAVNEVVHRVCIETPCLTWLTEAAPIEVVPGVALVGIDGFYDAGYGQPVASTRHMSDWSLIGELSGMSRRALVDFLQKQGRANAVAVEQMLRAALADYDEVILATHVSPWPGPTPVDHERLPWWTARYLGEAIERVALDQPTKKIHVIAGHSKTSSVFTVAANVTCATAKAERLPELYAHLRGTRRPR